MKVNYADIYLQVQNELHNSQTLDDTVSFCMFVNPATGNFSVYRDNLVGVGIKQYTRWTDYVTLSVDPSKLSISQYLRDKTKAFALRLSEAPLVPNPFI